GPLKLILMGAGSEFQHAVAAAKEIGDPGIRVVSIPSFHRFDLQPHAYREEVLPAAVEKRVAIEAGVPDLWWKYVGLKGTVIGIKRFGMSAPGGEVMKTLGITAHSVVEAGKHLLK
ncbi:MAG TPA: transketolase C-terminal domain-containing protein, partial [bacterium]|nr:transketolase C-terminal domain-containing protein [bacterium]